MGLALTPAIPQCQKEIDKLKTLVCCLSVAYKGMARPCPQFCVSRLDFGRKARSQGLVGDHLMGYPGALGELEPPPASLGKGVLCPPVLPGWFVGNLEGLLRML